MSIGNLVLLGSVLLIAAFKWNIVVGRKNHVLLSPSMSALYRFFSLVYRFDQWNGHHDRRGGLVDGSFTSIPIVENLRISFLSHN